MSVPERAAAGAGAGRLAESGFALPPQGVAPPSPEAPAPASGDRLFSLDACRATFVLLGIVLHAVFPFASEYWIVVSPHQSELLTHLLNFIHAFRMPAFFILSGFFAALVLAKRDPAAWVRSRSMRLGIPLLFGMLLVVPLESLAIVWVEHLSAPEGGTGAVLVAAFERHVRIDFHLVSHLWFILDLLLISLAFAALYSVLPGRVAELGRMIGDALARHPVMLGGAAIAALALYLVILEPLAPPLRNFIAFGGQYPKWHILDGERIAHYAPFFALGLLLFYSKPLFSAFARLRPLGWFAGSVATVTLLVVLSRPDLPWWLSTALSAPAAILLTQMAMHLASLLVTERNRVIQWLSEGSYTIYIVHHPIVILLASIAVLLDLPAHTGFLLVLAATTVLSVSFYALTRNVPVAAFLLNGIVPTPGRSGTGRRWGWSPPAA
jgi:glucans biosynthesis protein C